MACATLIITESGEAPSTLQIYVSTLPFSLTPPLLKMCLIICSLSLGGCGGTSGGASAPLDIATTPSDILSPPSDQLFVGFTDFPHAQERAVIINASTGAISTFKNEPALSRFLNKQPDPFDDILYVSDETSRSVALSSLSHLVSTHAPRLSGLSDFGLGSPLNPGQFMIFGRQGAPPSSALRYDMIARYFCSFCSQTVAQAKGVLALDLDTDSASMRLSNEAISLHIGFEITDNSLSAFAQTDRHDWQYEEDAIAIDSLDSEGHFYGAEGQEVGAVFTLHSAKGLLTGATIGAAQ